MVEMIKRRIIRARLIVKIIEPIMVNQFLEDGGSFMPASSLVRVEVKI